jgi:hypothetical protein
MALREPSPKLTYEDYLRIPDDGKRHEILGGKHYVTAAPLHPASEDRPASGDRVGRFSIRINDQYRVCFKWSEDEPADVEIVDYHS